MPSPWTPPLRRVLVEITSRCNLDCEFCIRRTWSAEPGDMCSRIFDKLIKDLQELPELPEVLFGGYGEPLLHPGILDMISRTAHAGARTSLVTNGSLLTREFSSELVRAGLNRIWISVDRAHQNSFQAQHQNGYREQISGCLEVFQDLKQPARSGNQAPGLEIGLSIVVTQPTLQETLELIAAVRGKGVQACFITNLEAYSSEQSRQALYQETCWDEADKADALIREKAAAVGMQVIGSLVKTEYSCPFAAKGQLAVRWDGEVSPCLPLLYDHVSFVGSWQRLVKACTFGNLRSATLSEIWEGEGYRGLRTRLLEEDFSPCFMCRDCWFSEDNRQDCMGYEHPTCGGCLWAYGLVGCP